MSGTTVNFRTDKLVKEQAEQIFNDLGLTLSSALNMFLKTTIRENGVPFDLKLDVPNETTAMAMAEAHRISTDSSVPGYSSMDALRAALDE